MTNGTRQGGFGLIGVIVIAVLVSLSLTLGYGVIQENFFTAEKQLKSESSTEDDRMLILPERSPNTSTTSALRITIPMPSVSPTASSKAIAQKSLASTPLQLTEQKETIISGASPIIRWSSMRKVLWKDESLGLQIAGPNWFEYRNTTGDGARNSDGTYKYTDWKKDYLKANVYQDTYNNHSVTKVDIQLGYGSPSSLILLNSKYKGQTFDFVVKDMLFPAEFCSYEYKEEPCEGDYCYNKNDVLTNLTVDSELFIGEAQAQLRSLKEPFNLDKDCRSYPKWLIKAKTGQFIITDIYSDEKNGSILRLEKY